MAGGVEVLVVFWKEWGIQALVLLSFALQVILRFLSDFRQCRDSAVLRAIIWPAYLLADTTAIYALGHMSVTSCSSSKRSLEHRLMALWAPLLLLHLGGQDNITAYSIEDNRLWLRHLQTFAVQVLAATYVLYESSVVARQTLLRRAAILMFVAGVLKYGERVWALKCASTSSLSCKNYKSFGRGPLPLIALQKGVTEFHWKGMYQVAEVQLSLMYQVFYSKAPVIHTWYGRCIRVISPMAILTAFLTFRRFCQTDGGNFNIVDVGVTYLVRCAMLKAGLPARYWSGSMGQHNFIHMCTQSRDSRSSRVARWMGREDWWNTLVYTSTIPVPADLSQLLEKQLLPMHIRYQTSGRDDINNSRGRVALKRMGVSQEELACWSVDIELDESILVWHIATHVYLSWYNATNSHPPALASTIEVLSNYMIFLLAARPYMLPDNICRQSYVELCNKVINQLEYSSADDLVSLLRQQGEALKTIGPCESPPEIANTEEENSTFDRVCQLSSKLIRKSVAGADMLDLIWQVWVEMLCYVSYKCSADSHARQLSKGGEITTVIAILMEYMRSNIFHSRLSVHLNILDCDIC
uniref:DUF4220 domain-containing protein n=1 Tax=Aegilops tauschii TaxID=37682 RepID=N1QZ82_AEGTA